MVVLASGQIQGAPIDVIIEEATSRHASTGAGDGVGYEPRRPGYGGAIRQLEFIMTRLHWKCSLGRQAVMMMGARAWPEVGGRMQELELP